MALVVGGSEDKLEQPHESSKADVLHRFIAKFFDFLIVGASAQIVPPVGFFIGLTYLLIADGLWQGQSIGKRVVGLYVIKTSDSEVGSFRESMLRNAPLAAGFIAGLIPYLGWFFIGAVILLEALLIIGNHQGLRIGDEIAQTRVMDHLPVPQMMG